MIKEGPYALMLDFRDAVYGPVETVSDWARRRVTLTGARASMTYWFYLSRQSEPPYVDCWMTDAVYIEPTAGQIAQGFVDDAFDHPRTSPPFASEALGEDEALGGSEAPGLPGLPRAGQPPFLTDSRSDFAMRNGG